MLNIQADPGIHLLNPHVPPHNVEKNKIKKIKTL